jgi:hypothetical protein
MARYERALIETITHPDDRKPDIRPGRERYFSVRKGPSAWLRVVIDFNGDEGFVVTAFGHDDDPS